MPAQMRYRYLRVTNGDDYLQGFDEGRLLTTSNRYEALRLLESEAKWLAQQLRKTDWPNAEVVHECLRVVSDAELNSTNFAVRHLGLQHLAENELFTTGRISAATVAAAAALISAR